MIGDGVDADADAGGRWLFSNRKSIKFNHIYWEANTKLVVVVV